MTNVIRHPNSHGAAARREIRHHLAGLGVPASVAYQAELKAQEMMDGGASPALAFDYALRPFRGQPVAMPGSFLSPAYFAPGGEIVPLRTQYRGRRVTRGDNPPPSAA